MLIQNSAPVQLTQKLDAGRSARTNTMMMVVTVLTRHMPVIPCFVIAAMVKLNRLWLNSDSPRAAGSGVSVWW